MPINDTTEARNVFLPWYHIYPFFLLHMLAFGGSGFMLAYGAAYSPNSLGGSVVPVLYVHGGFAILCYIVFYIKYFGLDEVKWMFINSGLGMLGVYAQVGWVLSFFDRKIGDYPFSVHVIPFLYYVLYTFLLRNALLDITRARGNEGRRRAVDRCYIAASIAVSLFSIYMEGR